MSLILTTPGIVKEDIVTYWMANKSRFPILYKMARDFLSIATTGVGVERLFNSARDICYFRRGRLDENTIFALMLQLMTDRFMIKEEFRRQREEGEEDIIDDEHNEEEAEELFQYISDIGEGEESDDDHAGQDVDNVPASPVRRSHRVERQPGRYHTLASGNSQHTQ